MKDINYNDIIKKVLGWGIGAVLMIAGVLIMACHFWLYIKFPQYMFVGFGLIIIGAIIYMTIFLIQHKEKLKMIDLKNQIIMSDDYDTKKKRYDELFNKTVVNNKKV